MNGGAEKIIFQIQNPVFCLAMSEATKPRVAVFVGRFQPPHKAHIETMHWALKNFDALIIVLGSAQTFANPKNPWNETQRHDMIQSCLSQEQQTRTHIVSVADDYYDDRRWFQTVRQTVEAIATTQNSELHIVGYDKDSSSYYLHGFPDWSFVASGVSSPLSATEVRKDYFENGITWQTQVPEAVAEHLKKFIGTPEFLRLQTEAKQIAWYRELDKKYPYSMVQVTVDAMVMANNSVLLVERAGNMGQGAWALPGGYLDKDETLLEAAKRELMEETNLDLKDMPASSTQVFDYPGRSLRGRVITHGHVFVLNGQPPLVKAADDAAKAFWFPLSDLPFHREKFFDDHYQIATWFLERL